MVDTFNAKLEGFENENGAKAIRIEDVKGMQEQDIKDILISLIKTVADNSTRVADVENILTKNNIK